MSVVNERKRKDECDVYTSITCIGKLVACVRVFF